MGFWTPTRVRQVTITLLGVTTFALAGSRVLVRYLKLSEIGEACLQGCRPGLSCLKSGMLGYCTKECAAQEDCPDNLVCKAIDTRSVCMLPPDREFGDRCSGDEECKTGRCGTIIHTIHGRRCALDRCLCQCGGNRECPEGAECLDYANEPHPLCVPRSLPREANEAYEAQVVRGHPNGRDLCY